VGSGSFWLLNDPSYYNANGTTNLSRLRAHLDAYKPADVDGAGLGVIRVSAFGTPIRYSGVDHGAKRYPCRRSSKGGANDGGNRFDCSQFDDAFFQHTLTTVREADARGIAIGIILWDEIPLEGRAYRWSHNPFCPDNNINGYGLPACSGNAVPEFYDDSSGKLRNHQDSIVQHFVEVLRDEPNVFFFISNEYTGGASWRDRQVATIDATNVALGSELLHVTMDYRNGPSRASDGVSADTNEDGLGSNSFRADSRPSIAQRDYRTASGDGIRRNMWRRFMDGSASAGTRDDYSGGTAPAAIFAGARDEDERLRKFVSSLTSRLRDLAPHDGNFGSGWDGRAAVGGEYVAYSSNSAGSITVDLSGESGNWRLLEWDPTDSLEPIDRGVQAGGAVRTWNVAKGEVAVVVTQTNFDPARTPSSSEDGGSPRPGDPIPAS
jgi:hypothetical protein